MVFRDQTGIVAMRVEEPRFFWSFMSNGTFRKWKLTFKPGVMDFTALFGEHGGRVNDVALSPPSQGHCKRHTILNHNCFLYTCSDDRTAKARPPPRQHHAPHARHCQAPRRLTHLLGWLVLVV